MATISSPGVGTNGLDVKSIITQLVALEKKPLDTLKVVGNVPPIAVADTNLESEDVVETPFQPVRLASLPAASEKAETSDLI